MLEQSKKQLFQLGTIIPKSGIIEFDNSYIIPQLFQHCSTLFFIFFLISNFWKNGIIKVYKKGYIHFQNLAKSVLRSVFLYFSYFLKKRG